MAWSNILQEVDVFRLVTSVRQRKISPHEESNFRPSDSHSDALPLNHKDSTVSEVYYEVHMTRVLHTAKISSVDSIMFVNGIRTKKSTEEKNEKNMVEQRSAESEGLRFDSSCTTLKIFIFVLRSWQDENHLSLFLYRAQNLPSLLFY